ncbi:MAG: lipopolysaccharide biosynthesis protein [Arachnia sp.]
MAENADAEPEQPADNRGLGRRAVHGALITLGGQAAKIIVQMASVVILARLLDPNAYGLLVMVTAVIGITDVFRDFGLSSAAIQAPTLSRKEQINLFWVNTGLGAALTGVGWLIAPLLAYIYGRPELIHIAYAMSFMFFINGMATQYRADLSRRMKFRSVVLTDISSSVVGLIVAVVMASQQFGVWALVAQQLAQVAFALVILVIAAGWLPTWYQRGVSIRPFLSFGWRLAFSQLVNYVGNNIDTLMLGLRVGAGPLGIYNRSYQLIMQPLGQIRGPLNTVAVPVLARLQSDEKRFQEFVARGQMAVGYSLVVLLAFVAGTAEPIVHVFLGDAWLEATNVLRLLAVAGGVTTLSYVGYWVYVTKGLVGHLLNYTFISVGIRVTCVLIGVQFGLVGVAAAMATAPMLAWPLSFWWLSRRASIPVRRLWLGGVRILAFCAVILAACLGVEAVSAGLPEIVRLLLGVVVALAVAGVLAVAVPFYRRDFGDVLGIVRETMASRRAKGGN